jgi:hypothetical protein
MFDFVDAFQNWDSRFGKTLLMQGYEKLDRNKKYVIAVVDNVKSGFVVAQLNERDASNFLDNWIDRYRRDKFEYLPRIMVINLVTGRVFKDPTEWSILRYSLSNYKR